MEQSDLHELWQADAGQGRQNKDRPAFVLEHADALADHVATDDPVPTKGLKDAREWLESYKATVTAQLAGVDGDGCPETTDDGDPCEQTIPCQYHGVTLPPTDATDDGGDE
jgi:hypothetical protein